jgi:uncharacterized membrane protein YphA (DoxX/SURF4 family)
MTRSTTRPRDSMRPAAPEAATTSRSPSSSVHSALQDWSGTIARIFLGLVCLWFGLSELTQPHLWTGYVPLISSTTTLATVLVLLHGGLLFVLGVALVVGIAPSTAALIVALFLAEIVIDLTVGHGINDIAVRDLGVLGLAFAVFGSTRQRLTLTD